MRGKEPQSAGGRGGTAPLLGQSTLTFTTFTRARNDRVAMQGGLRVCRTANAASRGSLDFQTCRIADVPKSAAREAAPEVGLEICAATVSRGDVTDNLRLSLVASCHR